MPTSRDFILNKQLVLHQHRAGYRVAVDSLLVGAMVDKTAQHLLDMGAGVGAVSLVAGFWNPETTIDAVENNADYFLLLEKNLLAENAALGGLIRFFPHHQDIHQFSTAKEFCQVLINPPFDQANATTITPDELKTAAFVFHIDDNIKNWWRVGLRLLRPAGRLSFITRGNMEPTIIDFFKNAGGRLTLQPVMAGTRVVRLLADFQKDSSHNFTIIKAQDFILQEKVNGKMVYSQQAESILRGRAHHLFPF